MGISVALVKARLSHEARKKAQDSPRPSRLAIALPFDEASA